MFAKREASSVILLLDDGAAGQWHAPPMCVPWDLHMRLACRVSWLWQLLLNGITMGMQKLGSINTFKRCTAWRRTVPLPISSHWVPPCCAARGSGSLPLHMVPGLPPGLQVPPLLLEYECKRYSHMMSSAVVSLGVTRYGRSFEEEGHHTWEAKEDRHTTHPRPDKHCCRHIQAYMPKFHNQVVGESMDNPQVCLPLKMISC
jgi:hypothetical protein